MRTATVRIDSETAGVLSLGIDHFENVLASMGNQQEDVMRKVAELNSEREQANLRILGGAVVPLGVGGINGVESGPFELQELTKSPYKMYERNPHTKCMREIPTQNV